MCSMKINIGITRYVFFIMIMCLVCLSTLSIPLPCHPSTRLHHIRLCGAQNRLFSSLGLDINKKQGLSE